LAESLQEGWNVADVSRSLDPVLSGWADARRGDRREPGAPAVTLPANPALVHELLAAHGAPMPLEEIAELARAQGAHLTAAQLRKLAERFPQDFVLSADDRLSARLVPQADDMIPSQTDDSPNDGVARWWEQPAGWAAIDLARVIVLDIETTGLIPSQHSITQIALGSLDGGAIQTWQIESMHGGADAGASQLDHALREVNAALGTADAVCGHNIGRFDLPFLERAAREADAELVFPDAVLDVHELSLLVDPQLDGRSLGDLCAWLDVPHVQLHDARNDVEATAAVAKALLDRVDPAAPSWSLALRLLQRNGSAWVRLFAPPPPVELTAALQARADPLAATQGPIAPSTASKASTSGLAQLRADSGLADRPAQQQMCDDVAERLDRGGRLLVEAPTGTGKSLAYLIAAAGRATTAPVVIATHTKVLQRQLRDDAERLRSAGILNVPFRQVQGVENYLCVREIAESISNESQDRDDWLAAAIATRALDASTNGVWDDVTDGLLRQHSWRYAQARAQLTTSSSSCERSNCEWKDQCPMMGRVDDIAAQPGIISANHAVIASWLADETPSAPAGMFGERPTDLILDEAHTLEDSIAAAWTREVGAASLRRMFTRTFERRGPVRRLARVAHQLSVDDAIFKHLEEFKVGLLELVERLGQAAEDVIHNYGGQGRSTELLPAHRNKPEHRAMLEAARRLAIAVEGLSKMIGAAAAMTSAAADDSGRSPRDLTRASRMIHGLRSDLDRLAEDLRALAEVSESHLWVHVLSAPVDARRSDKDATPLPPAVTWAHQRTPIEIGSLFAARIAAVSHSITLTSATLTIDGDPSFLCSRLGISAASDTGDPNCFDLRTVPSPFDYDQQSTLVLTSHLPVPTPTNEREFVEETASDQVGFLSLSYGKALTLFAARTRMEAVAELVDTKGDELAERGVSLLVQGREAPGEIRRRFRGDAGTALFGLRSYWEGFDAPGETLSYLFIEKPPYPHPGDPLTRARQRVIEDRGGDPFLEYVVPRTAITLAQGFGRLIRSETDRGAALIYDRRVLQPKPSNTLLLGAIPTKSIVEATSRDSAWTSAIEFVTGEAPDISQAIELITNTTVAALEELRLLPGEDPTLKLRAAAREIFKIDQVHENQLELMRAVLSGRDALGLLPTGRGKSLCFQLPSLLHPEQLPFVVVSPLVALIKDQVDDLRARRGLRSIAGITGRTSVAERTEILRDLADGRVRLMYLSPERLARDPNLQNALRQTQLGCLVVDEAHCISSWGHDFRPEFRQIAPAMRELPRSPRLGLTATATPDVERDIIDTLEMDDPLIVREPTDRPDLSYWTIRCSNDRERTRETLRFIADQGDAPGIVYASRRALTEELAWVMRQAGLGARAYHAGLLPEQREAIQDDFLAGNVQIIAATKAFGMGINKSDIGWVLHYDLPDSIESYAQEAGRAARDPSLTATVAMLWHGGDLQRRRRHLSQETGFSDLVRAQKVLDAIRCAPTRGTDHIVSGDELAELVDLEEDELNVMVAWLEQSGSVQRKPDCTLHGHVTLGRSEPEDHGEKRDFIRLTKGVLKCRVGSRRMVDLEAVAEASGRSPDELESQLAQWSLSRFVTFQSTRRAWRIQVLSSTVDRQRYRRLVTQWRSMQAARLDAIAAYVHSNECRRVVIARQFGDNERPCTIGDGLPCGVCAGTSPPWHEVALHQVPDPESFVDVKLTVLQAIQWMSRNRTRPFGEGTIKSVVLGDEFRGQHPVSPAALSCPQFGALRHVKAKSRRYDEAVIALLEQDLVERFSHGSEDRDWSSVRTTSIGAAALGAPGQLNAQTGDAARV